ncbi:kinase-like domain-containing protein [Syncephalis plumigaleata]|nr:kinase-like domain-containing protein [Syncephalis plumigaleata]
MSKQAAQRHPDSNESEQDDSTQSVMNSTPPTTFLLGGHDVDRSDATKHKEDDDEEDDEFSLSPTPPLPDAVSTELTSEQPSNTIPASDMDYPVSNHSATSSISLDPHRKADLLARAIGEDRWRMEHTREYPNSSSSHRGHHADGDDDDDDDDGEQQRQQRRLPPRPCAPPPITPPPLSQMETSIMRTNRRGSTNSNSDTGNDAAPVSSSSTNANTNNNAAVLDPTRKRYPNDFVMGRHLGEGSYSTVILATEKLTKKRFAIKILDKRHIVKEKKTKNDSFDETCAQFYGAEIVQAVAYLHSQGVVHRDLKPENILLDEHMHIKLTDFGTAKLFEPDHNHLNDRSNSFVGTAEYVSPELLTNKSATRSCDWWAFGCIIYQLLAGRPPFKAANEYLTFQKIIQLDYKFPSGFPTTARDLVQKLLVLDPEQRLGSGQSGLYEMQSHDFFANIDWDQLTQQTPPRLLPYLPPVDHHNEEALRSNSEAMLFQPDRHYPATPQIEPDMLLFSEAEIRPSRDSQESDGIPWSSASTHYNNGHDGQQGVLVPPPRLRVMNDGVVRPIMPANSTTSSMSSSIMSVLDDQMRLHHPTPNRRHAVEHDTHDTASITDAGSFIPPEMEPFSPRSYNTSFSSLIESRPPSRPVSRPSSSRAITTYPLSQSPGLYTSTSVGAVPSTYTTITSSGRTNYPRLIYADAHHGRIKGSVYFTARMLPEFKDSKHFFIHTPSKTHYFEDTSKQARVWVDTVNELIKEQFGDTL